MQNRRSVCSSVPILLLLAGCAHQAELPTTKYNTSKSIAEVGRFTFVGEDVGLWQDLEAKFRPAFPVSAAQALTSVSAASQFSVESNNRVTSAGLTATLAGTSINNTSTIVSSLNNTLGGSNTNTTNTGTANATTTGAATQNSSGTNSQQDTSSRTTSQQTPAIPANPTPYAQAAQTLATLGAPSVPPVSAYSAADSLIAFQNLLNLGHKFHRFGYDAHLILLKVGIQVAKNRQPYDAYIDVSFLPSGHGTPVSPGLGQSPYDLHLKLNLPDDAGGRSIGAVASQPPTRRTEKPLYIITFAETSGENLQQDVAAQASQQLALNIGAAAGPVAASANIQDLVTALNHSMAIRPNSLVTVGADGPNNLSIKLGANRFGDEYELESFSHDVAVILLTPDEMADSEVTAIARISYLNPTGGDYPEVTLDSTAIDLRNRSIRRIALTIDDAVTINNGTDPADAPFAGCAAYKPAPDSDQTPNNCKTLFSLAAFIGANQPGQYYEATDALKISRPIANSLYGYLEKYSTTPGLAFSQIFLLPTDFSCPPSALTPLIIDDGDNATLNIQAGRGFRSKTVTAYLSPPGTKLRLAAIANNGTDVVGPIVFPSFKPLLQPPPNGKQSVMTLPAAMTLYADDDSCGDYTAYYVPPKTPAAGAAAAHTAVAKQAVGITIPGSFTFAAGQGSFDISAAIDTKQADSFSVSASPAELVSVGDGKLDNKGVVTVAADGVFAVVLKGVFEKQTVTLKFQPLKTGKPVGVAISKTITAHSQAAPTSSPG